MKNAVILLSVNALLLVLLSTAAMPVSATVIAEGAYSSTFSIAGLGAGPTCIVDGYEVTGFTYPGGTQSGTADNPVCKPGTPSYVVSLGQLTASTQATVSYPPVPTPAEPIVVAVGVTYVRPPDSGPFGATSVRLYFDALAGTQLSFDFSFDSYIHTLIDPLTTIPDGTWYDTIADVHMGSTMHLYVAPPGSYYRDVGFAFCGPGPVRTDVVGGCSTDSFTVPYSGRGVLTFWEGIDASSSEWLVLPEPGTLALLGLGLVGVGVSQRRKA